MIKSMGYRITNGNIEIQMYKNKVFIKIKNDPLCREHGSIIIKIDQIKDLQQCINELLLNEAEKESHPCFDCKYYFTNKQIDDQLIKHYCDRGRSTKYESDQCFDFSCITPPTPD